MDEDYAEFIKESVSEMEANGINIPGNDEEKRKFVEAMAGVMRKFKKARRSEPYT